MSIKDYSTTAGSNTSIDGINIAEGCLPGNVNNAMRAMMADTRSFYQSGGWIDLGYTHTYASSTSFTVSSDVTAFYPVGQRVRAVGATTGTIYGTITDSAYSAPNTTVTVSWDSGSLQSEALTVSVSFMTVTGSPVSAGDVTGPASATDNAVALFDGTTGKALKVGVLIGVASGNIQQVNQAETTTASATTTTLGTSLKHGITGTTTITAFNGVAGVTYRCRADGAFILTHDGTNLDILQTGADITTASDDTFDVYMRTTTTCEIRNYQRASGEALTTSVLTLGTPVATTSGTSKDFSSIPSGTKRITINFVGASFNSTSTAVVQIGDSGGLETSGYTSKSSAVGSTTAVTSSSAGFAMYFDAAGNTYHGKMVLDLENAANNTWVSSHDLAVDGTNVTLQGGGSKSLSGELDRLRITTPAGTAVFDAGEINISYE